MLGHVLGALVALFGLFGVGAVVCVQLSGPSSLGADAGMTGFSLSYPSWTRINYDLRGLAAWGGLGSPACNRSIFWAVGQTRGAPHHFYTDVCCVLRMSSKS